MNRAKHLAQIAAAILVGILALATWVFAQDPLERPTVHPPGGVAPNQTRLPNGKLQSDEILKQDYESNLKDVKAIQKLAEEIKTDLEKNERFVLSMGNLKKLEEIEKTSQRIRGRMRRW